MSNVTWITARSDSHKTMYTTRARVCRTPTSVKLTEVYKSMSHALILGDSLQIQHMLWYSTSLSLSWISTINAFFWLV